MCTRLFHHGLIIVLAGLALLAAGCADGAEDPAIGAGPSAADATVVPSDLPAGGIDPDATALPAPPVSSTDEADLPPIVIDEALGITGSGVGGGSIELRGTANTFEALVALELLDLQGNIIESTFTTATCGSGCRGDWTHTFGDLEPGEYTVVATEDDPSGGEGPPPYETQVVVEVPRP